MSIPLFYPKGDRINSAYSQITVNHYKFAGKGDAHALRAEMNGAALKVFVDNVIVWEGSVGRDALVFDGPVGIRSDNARLQIELRAARPLEAQSTHLPGCRSAPEESE